MSLEEICFGGFAMRVLVACEFSGTVRDAFASKGHDAWSCDLLPSEKPGQHIQGDVLPLLGNGWDLVIAHPPCTYLSYAGNVWMKQPGRGKKRDEAMRFFLSIWESPTEKMCIENPVGYPRRAFRLPDQIIHPYHFGDKARKATCLWLRGLPLLAHETREAPAPCFVEKSGRRARHWTDNFPGNRDRAKNRSRTFPGIANAMAEQWGGCNLFKEPEPTLNQRDLFAEVSQ